MTDDAAWDQQLITYAAMTDSLQHGPAVRALWCKGWLVEDIAVHAGIPETLVRHALNNAPTPKDIS